MSSLNLSYRRADMAAFWILTAALVAVSAGTAAAVLGASWPWAWGMAAAVAIAAPALISPSWAEAGIWLWNGSTRRAVAMFRRYVLFVSYYTVYAALGRTGASLGFVLAPAETSRWSGLALRSGQGLDGAITPSGRNWFRNLRTCAEAGGNRWMLSLAPIVLLLTLLEDEHQDSVPPGSTYTLY